MKSIQFYLAGPRFDAVCRYKYSRNHTSEVVRSKSDNSKSTRHFLIVE